VQAGRGLAAAHDAGIQHRDFKPGNMLIGKDGRVVVADFGIAASLRTVENADPRWGTPTGTPAYMAPERLRGEPGDARSDQFSFCVAMWRGLYGLRPFEGEQLEELLEAIELGDVRTNPDVNMPRWLTDVVRKGLADDPDDRHRNMHELVAALDRPPGDESEVDEPGDEGPYVEVDGRVLHQPGAASSARASRLTFFVALSLVGVAVLGIVGYLHAVERSSPRSSEAPDLEPAPMPAPPCVLDDADAPEAEVDPVVLEVCRSIRIDHYQAGDMLWEREHAGRLHETRATAAEGRPASTLGVDTLIVARTFLDRAEELERTNPDKARVAATHAHNWARQAGMDLGNPQDPRVQDIERRANRFAAQATDG